jgi:hypothetical protein
MDKPTDTAVVPRYDREAMEYIEQALRGLQFGEVTATVQDGVVVQVQRAERKRISRRSRKA